MAIDSGYWESNEGCELCNSEVISIQVITKELDNVFLFSSDEDVGLMYCPLCGRDLRR